MSLSQSLNLDAPACNADGTLKDAAEIDWQFSASEDAPVIPAKNKKKGSSYFFFNSLNL
jgi:hypothetical protein